MRLHLYTYAAPVNYSAIRHIRLYRSPVLCCQASLREASLRMLHSCPDCIINAYLSHLCMHTYISKGYIHPLKSILFLETYA